MALAIVIVYLFAMIGIGVYFYNKTRTGSDFVLGGRDLGSIVAALTVNATGLSGWLYLGVAGMAYTTGLSTALWYAIMASLGPFLAWILIAKRVRYISGRLEALTIPDLLEARFADEKSHVIRLISAVVLLITSSIYVGSLLMQSGKALNTMFGWQYAPAILLAAIFTGIYVYLGGFSAVCFTDAVQGLIMIFGAMLAAIMSISKVGGFSNLTSGLINVDPALVNLNIPLITIIGFFATGPLAYMSVPQTVIRYMAVRSEREIKKAIIWSAVTAVLLNFSVVFAGAAARLIYPQVNDPEVVLIMLFKDMGPILGGLFIAVLLSAVMSTVDSILHVSSTVITRDITQKFLMPSIDEKKLVVIGRVTTIVLTVIGILVALKPFNLVLWVTWWAWAGLTAFGGPIFLALFWKRATRAGCIAALISGFVLSAYWQFFGAYELIHPCLVAYFGGLAAGVVVSLFTSPKNEIWIDFYSNKEKSESFN